MLISVERKQFIRSVALLKKYITQFKDEHICRYIRFTYTTKWLQLAVFDLANSVAVEQDLMIIAQDASDAPEQFFIRADVFNNLPFTGDHLIITIARDLTICSLRSGDASIVVNNTYVKADLWSIPNPSEPVEYIETFPAKDFSDIFSFVISSTARGDGTRPVLNMIKYLRNAERVTLVAADGFRLHRAIYRAEYAGHDTSLLIWHIPLVPMLQHARGNNGEVQFSKRGSRLIFNWLDLRVKVSFEESTDKFPDVAHLIADNLPVQAEVERLPLQSLLSSVRKWENGNNNRTMAIHDGNLEVKNGWGELKMHNILKFVNTESGANVRNVEIAVNVVYLWLSLCSLPMSVKAARLLMADRVHPFQMRAEQENKVKYTAVIMPMSTK